MRFSVRVTAAALFLLAVLARGAYSQAPAGGAAPTPLTGDKTPDGAYVIGADDLLAVSVWKEPDISRSILVRSDGKISLPLAGEVIAAGQTPQQLEQEITARLKSYITNPEVTVIVQQMNSEKYNILGQVAKPGAYPLTSATTIVDAIATAGGFKDFAKKKGIYILRRNAAGVEAHIAFNYQDYVKGHNPGQNITLQPHDTIIVP